MKSCKTFERDVELRVKRVSFQGRLAVGQFRFPNGTDYGRSKVRSSERSQRFLNIRVPRSAPNAVSNNLLHLPSTKRNCVLMKRRPNILDEGTFIESSLQADRPFDRQTCT